ncbi:hypothetical protein FHX82_002429 [Amycolatopsis bartoniae]|uniref:DUF3618 domain-containing protein n=1 Tax=Amycolatopsis bartoniae TaxID=941986 RepID=A0A8H9J1Q8_9PSEU|nr:DUF3618 domain-containing protein [Amycolatopsis bartoniae]MBB2935375.1 hypothetical protein [Amycolatopsis bartoniae]TVS99901.1 DUF3618 domain-containing protein [Amycolatopsis bartoniae]GHF75634.1 hypothetical protein GCM10017566_56800 [Amycolatopsis bartoniae]
MSESDTFPRNAEQARLDAELTRQELGETAEALAAKVKETAHTTERAALTTGAAVGVALLVFLIIKKIVSRR